MRQTIKLDIEKVGNKGYFHGKDTYKYKDRLKKHGAKFDGFAWSAKYSDARIILRMIKDNP